MIEITTTAGLRSALDRIERDRLVLRADLSFVDSADALSRALIVQLRTDPEMSIERPMHWDALVDGICNGFDLAPLERRRLVIVLGPLHRLRSEAPDAFAILGDWLEQLVQRAENGQAPPERLRIIVYGDGPAFEAGS